MFPAIKEALREWRQGMGSMPEPLQLKEVIAGFSTTTGDEWLQRNGYYRLAQYNGNLSHAGVAVTNERALESSAVYACVKIIAEDMGALDFLTYQTSADGLQIDLARSHRLFSVLKHLVNPDVSSGEFVEALTAHACLTGNGFAEIQPKGTSVFLWPWQPHEVRIDQDSRKRLFYIHKEGNSAEKTYERSKVFHLRGLTFDGVNGDDLLRRARHSIGLSLAMQQYAGSYFANDATPGVVISRPREAPVINPEGVTLFKKEWAKWHQGVSKSHEPVLLQEGMTVTPLAPTAGDVQLVEQRKAQVVEVCRHFRMPPHKLADLDRSTNNNIEHQGIEYVTNTLYAWVDRWKRAVHRCLLTTDEQLADRIFAEHDVSPLLRGDFKSQAEGLSVYLDKGAIRVNEVRTKFLKLNPEPHGDNLYMQMNMTEISKIAQGLNLKAASNGKQPEEAA